MSVGGWMSCGRSWQVVQNLPHCAAIRSRKSCATFSSGPLRGLMKVMRSFGCDLLALIRWIPSGILRLVR